MKMSLLVLAFGLPFHALAVPDSDAKPETIELFERGPNDPSLPAPNLRPSAIGVVAEYPVVPRIRALAATGLRSQLVVALPDGKEFVVPVRRFEPMEGFIIDEVLDVVPDPTVPDSKLSFHWYGVAQGSEVSLTVYRGTLAGRVVVSTATNVYTFALVDGHNVMRVIDPDAIPMEPEDVVDVSTKGGRTLASPKAPSRRKAADYIDMLVLHTQDAINAAGGQANLDALIAASVANMSTSLANSDVVSVVVQNVLPNGAQSVLIPYNEINNCFGEPTCTATREFEMHKRWLRNDAGVQQLRNQYAADLVLTFVGDNAACGIAYTQRPDCGASVGEPFCNVGPNYNAFAYAAVSSTPACDNWTFGMRPDIKSEWSMTQILQFLRGRPPSFGLTATR